jgi:hypothetical protein
MSVEDLHRTRTNAMNLLEDPKRAADAEQVLDAIDAELERRYLPGMLASFREVYPGGFYGERQAVEERDYKVKASELCLSLLGENEFADLLGAKNWIELFERVKRVVNQTNFIQGSFEKPKLFDAIRDENNAPAFFRALYDVMWGKAEFFVRFQHYCDVLESLGLNKWTYATYFSFLADPQNAMFVKPEMLKKSLEISRYPLNYESMPSADLYRQILKFSSWLKARIAELEPRDMIDVHSFMWHMAPTGKWSED